MRIKLILISLLSLGLLTGCVHRNFSKPIIQQGNLLPEEKLSRLKTGMSKEEVTLLMGTSLLSPTFNNDRWDYAYTYEKNNKRLSQKHLSLYFSNDRLVEIKEG